MSMSLVSIIVATYNSEKTLPMVLGSVRKQIYNQDKVEILLIDGGSTDSTLEIGKKYKCRIIKNPRVEPVYAKFIAYKKARGKYLMYLDHDEVLENPKSISTKVNVLEGGYGVRAVAGGNYKNPPGYPFINNYINEFGDPFSFFIYRLSKRNEFFLPAMKKKFPVFLESDEFVIFDLSDTLYLPIIELVAGGSMFDANVLKNEFPRTKTRFEISPHYFYLLFSKYKKIAVIKNDPILHYSSDTINKYIKKIIWRIKNNIYFKQSMGESGFSGRERYQPSDFRFKKYLFIPYSFSLIFPLIDSASLALTRRNLLYFIHIPLCLFTSTQIIYHLLLKVIGSKPRLRNYDDSTAI